MGFFDRFAPTRQQAPTQAPRQQGGMFGTALPDPVKKCNELEQNPAGFGEVWKLPPGMTDGEQILDYLVQTGQVNPALIRNPLVLRAAQMLSAQRK